MDTKRQIWEQEIYYQMKYRKSKSCFHTFEGEESMIGIYFADEGEGEHFFFTINDRLSKTLNRESRRIVRQQSRSKAPESKVQTGLNPIMELVTPMVPKKNKKGKKDKKPKLSKDDIGKPTNFVHAQGIKSGPSGFEQVDNIGYDEELRKFLSHAGIPSTVMDDPQKKKEVERFVEKNEVIHKMTIRRKKPPGITPPAKPPPQPAAKISGAPPPPPPPPPPPAPPSIQEPGSADGPKRSSDKGNIRSKPGSGY